MNKRQLYESQTLLSQKTSFEPEEPFILKRNLRHEMRDYPEGYEFRHAIARAEVGEGIHVDGSMAGDKDRQVGKHNTWIRIMVRAALSPTCIHMLWAFRDTATGPCAMRLE